MESPSPPQVPLNSPIRKREVAFPPEITQNLLLTLTENNNALNPQKGLCTFCPKSVSIEFLVPMQIIVQACFY